MQEGNLLLQWFNCIINKGYHHIPYILPSQLLTKYPAKVFFFLKIDCSPVEGSVS